jgi:sirohydrochlorin ferrochelatase
MWLALGMWLLMIPSADCADRVGVLVLAHGGTNRWDGMVRKAVREADLDLPTEVTLGMGMDAAEARLLQHAVNRLQRRGVSRIVVVPLLVSSHSEVFRQYEYLFGLRAEAEWPEAGKPLALQVPVVMGQALDDSAVVADILLERARALSRQPQEETVIIVAHGPNTDADNERWLSAMRRVTETIQQKGRFRAAVGLTMRDDAPKPIREQATARLREAVQAASRQGRALVVPLLLAQGGVERKIPKLLAGLTYVYTGDALLPHERLVQWIAEQATRLAGVGGEAPGAG